MRGLRKDYKMLGSTFRPPCFWKLPKEDRILGSLVLGLGPGVLGLGSQLRFLEMMRVVRAFAGTCHC